MAKVNLTEEQKEQIKKEIVLRTKTLKRKRVRIPERIEDISILWLQDAPFYSEFLLRFNYWETEAIPTMGVNCVKGKINLFINNKFLNGGGEFPKLDDKEKPIIKKDKKGKPILDEHGNIQLEMEPWEGLNDLELEGLLVHEIHHLIRCHQERELTDPELFNIAGDMLINDSIKGSRIGNRDLKLPPGGVYLDMAKEEGYKDEPITEPLYYFLEDLQQKFQNAMKDLLGGQQNQTSCPNCGGSGKQKQECESCGGTGKQQEKCKTCGGSGQQKDKNGNNQPCPDCNGSGDTPNGQEQPCPDCNGTGEQEQDCPSCNGSGKQNSKTEFDAKFGSKFDDHSFLEENDEIAEITLKDIIDNGKVHGWGKISGNLQQTLEELTKKSKISWKQLLRKYLSNFVHDVGNWFENSWSRRNRRQLPLPGIKKLSNKIMVAIDTSGSIQNTEIEQFFAEIETIIKDFSQLVVIQWDTEINDVWQSYKRNDWKKIIIKGRGGTSVQCVFDWISEEKMNKFPVVIFTDGYFDHNFDTLGTHNVIWACTTENYKIPKGVNIHIDIEN